MVNSCMCARLRAHEELYCKEQAMVNRRSVMGLAARRTIALGLAPLGLAAMAAEPGAPLPPLGSTLAAPSLTLLDGSVWGPEQSRGKVLVLYWWASWCPFCAEQSPHIDALWRAHRSQGLELLALSIDKQPAAASAHLKAKGYGFPAAMATQVAAVWPKPRGLPVVVVRGRDGKVVYAESGSLFPEDVQGLKKFL
jgi:thiol-disulfide isomerase/thioredoxin